SPAPSGRRSGPTTPSATANRRWPPTGGGSRSRRPTPAFPRRSSRFPGRGPRRSTTSAAGRRWPRAATSPPPRNPRRWPPTSGRSSATCAEAESGRPAEPGQHLGAEQDDGALHEQRRQPQRLGPVADVVAGGREPDGAAHGVGHQGRTGQGAGRQPGAAVADQDQVAGGEQRGGDQQHVEHADVGGLVELVDHVEEVDQPDAGEADGSHPPGDLVALGDDAGRGLGGARLGAIDAVMVIGEAGGGGRHGGRSFPGPPGQMRETCTISPLTLGVPREPAPNFLNAWFTFSLASAAAFGGDPRSRPQWGSWAARSPPNRRPTFWPTPISPCPTRCRASWRSTPAGSAPSTPRSSSATSISVCSSRAPARAGRTARPWAWRGRWPGGRSPRSASNGTPTARCSGCRWWRATSGSASSASN